MKCRDSRSPPASDDSNDSNDTSRVRGVSGVSRAQGSADSCRVILVTRAKAVTAAGDTHRVIDSAGVTASERINDAEPCAGQGCAQLLIGPSWGATGPGRDRSIPGWSWDPRVNAVPTAGDTRRVINSAGVTGSERVMTMSRAAPVAGTAPRGRSARLLGAVPGWCWLLGSKSRGGSGAPWAATGIGSRVIRPGDPARRKLRTHGWWQNLTAVKPQHVHPYTFNARHISDGCCPYQGPLSGAGGLRD